MLQVLVLRPDDDPSLFSKLDAVWTELLTSELFVIVNIYRRIGYTNRDVPYLI
jgi:hypothetical protein